MSRSFQESTFGTSTNDLEAQASDSTLPGLTLLYHPELSRVGERALLSGLMAGNRTPLSRLAPAFAHPGQTTGPRPLEHRALSRSPLELEPFEDGVRLRLCQSRTRVSAAGEPVLEDRLFSAAELERGIVLELGNRVVVLLHRLVPVHDAALPHWGLVGESPPMIALRQQIRQVAPLGVPVLLRGETGTGKELVAAALHRAGPRRDRPWLSVNAAAIPPPLAAAELFGAARGAFTGADRRREGYFARADLGTLFLDEVGEMPVEVQTLLLRCLESGEIQPVGEATSRRVDVRLVTATDADLEAAVREGRFRAPLLHRLAGFRITLPPLRERREDFGRLLVEFLRRELEALGAAHRLEADPPWAPAALVARLADLEWTGNVRQLRNAVQQMAILYCGQERIPAADHEALIAAMMPSEEPPPETPISASRPSGDAGESLVVPNGRSRATPAGQPAGRKPADVGEDELIAALRAEHWRPHAAARRLRIPRPSIYHLMKKSRRVRLAAELELGDIEPGFERLKGDIVALAAELEVSERALRRRLRQLGLV